MIARFALLLLVWLALAAPLRAQDLQAVPPLTARVIDQTGTLTPQQTAALETKLAAFEAESGPQVVVLLVPTTQPEDIAAYAQRIGDAWKIGRREVGDGLLIVVAKGDRRINIQTAKALEGAIPDLAARQIIDRAIKPAFRADDYAGGLNAALDMLFARIRGEALPPPTASLDQRSTPAVDWNGMLMFFFVGVPVVGSILTRVMGRRLGALTTAGATGGLAWWLSANTSLAMAAGLGALVLIGIFGIGAAATSGRRGRSHDSGSSTAWGGGGLGSWGGGGGSGWSGGGDFSSGGGGDFGGGGASGDW